MLPDRFGTERLILRPIEAADAGAIFSGYAQDAEVVRFLTFPPHRNLGDTESYIARCLATPASRATATATQSRAEPLLAAGRAAAYVQRVKPWSPCHAWPHRSKPPVPAGQHRAVDRLGYPQRDR